MDMSGVVYTGMISFEPAYIESLVSPLIFITSRMY